jgi:hypothetical protein
MRGTTDPFDFEDDPEPPPRRRRKEKPERPWGGDLFFFGAVVLTLFLPIVGIVVGLIDMGGRTAARRSKGLGLLLFGLVMAVLYAGYVLR